MCNRPITVSSFPFVRGQDIHSFNSGNMLYHLFSGNSSHSDCHSFNIYLFVRGFRSENGMSSTEMSPSRASLSPFLTGRMFVRPNILRTHRRTMIRFLIELLVRRIWSGQSKLYFILNWLVMRCKLRPEFAADAQQTA